MITKLRLLNDLEAHWLVKLGIASFGSMGFGIAYERGWVEPKKPLQEFVREALKHNKPGRIQWDLLWSWLFKLKHYDINYQYEYWLCKLMVYACAYFKHDDMTLDEAQIAKFELIAKKLRLKPGMRVLELGSGWGAFKHYLETHYGVTVVSYNLSKEQYRYCIEKYGQQGFILDSFHNASGTFDRVVTIGMPEHVGIFGLNKFFKTISKRLKVGGFAVVHYNGRFQKAATDFWLRAFIFQGGYLHDHCSVIKKAAKHGLQLIHHEKISEHYPPTLGWWLTALEAKTTLTERFKRRMRLYLISCIESYNLGRVDLNHDVFVKRAG